MKAATHTGRGFFRFRYAVSNLGANMSIVEHLAGRLAKTKHAKAMTSHLEAEDIATVGEFLAAGIEGVTVGIANDWRAGVGSRPSVSVRAVATVGDVHAKMVASTEVETVVVVINEQGRIASRHVALEDIVSAAAIGDVVSLFGADRRWPTDAGRALLLVAERLFAALGLDAVDGDIPAELMEEPITETKRKR